LTTAGASSSDARGMFCRRDRFVDEHDHASDGTIDLVKWWR
jgi:hypothetical protein